MLVFALVALLLSLCSACGFHTTTSLILESAQLGTNSFPRNRFSAQLPQLHKSRLKMTDLLRGGDNRDHFYQLATALREERSERIADNEKIRNGISS